MLEDKVLALLKTNIKPYTKTIYMLLSVKQLYGMSIDKFRLFLRDLEKQGKIK